MWTNAKTPSTQATSAEQQKLVPMTATATPPPAGNGGRKGAR